MTKSVEHPIALALFLIVLTLHGPALSRPAAATGLPAQDILEAGVAPRPEAISATEVEQALTVVDGIVGRQPVYNELLACGVAPSDALSVTSAFKGIFDFRKAQPEDEYQVCLTPQRKLHKLTYRAGITDRYVAIRTDGGAFRAYHEKIPLDKEIIAKTFTIDSSLYQAVTDQGEGYQLVTDVADIFSWDIDFYLYPRKGDAIRVLFERYSLKGRFVKYGKILAAQYIGSSQTFSAFYFDDDRQAGYYDEKGTPLRKEFLRVPVKFGKRTSSFSLRRFHPISKSYRRHTGIDYGVPSGTPIFATANGRVEFSGWKGGYGKLVILHHGNGFQTYYGHCSRLLIREGAHVKQGQMIARVGKTGQATGPHVHYETRINGKPVNPGSIKTARANPLPPELLAGFEETVRARRRLFEEILLSENKPAAGIGL